MYMYIYIYIYIFSTPDSAGPWPILRPALPLTPTRTPTITFPPSTACPLQDIAIINTVWCIAYEGGGRGGGHILRKRRAIVHYNSVSNAVGGGQ